MFEKLLSLLLHAKGGAVATVLVLGASGALVTATVENGTTTIKITQPSSVDAAVAPVTVTTASNTASTNTTVDPAILALFTRTNAEDDPTSPATGGNGCSDAAKANNEQVKAINTAFKTDHQTVNELRKDARTDAAKTAVSDADKAIKDIRQAAVKAIHATNPSATCKADDDEDVDEDNNEDDGDDDNSTPTTTTPAVVFSGDAKAIADAAISAMAQWVTDAKAAVAAQPAATTATNTKKSDKAGSANKSNRDSHDNRGKGGSSHGDD
jgi:hypothetical protein